MVRGRIPLSSVPIRKEPSDASEMINQLIFGEEYLVLEETEKWIRIRSLHDDYGGWLDRKQHRSIDEQPDEGESSICTGEVRLIQADELAGHTLSPGSILHGACHDQIGLGSEVFDIKGDTGVKDRYTLVDNAQLFLNTPYLWGGRTMWGIDCSGLTQILFRLVGIPLKRDAGQQVLQGSEVSFNEIEEGDLAFFNNSKGRITHVGVAMKNGRIIHASGKVRIDMLDETGIRIEYSGEYSHRLHSIRRM